MKDMSWGNQIEQFMRRQPEAFRFSLFEREKTDADKLKKNR